MNKIEIEKLLESKHDLTSEQREAVECFKNCVVKAGAGAGKTMVLSYRFINLILKNKANCDEILTLTFTKKAAAEMYERIYQQLISLKDKSPIIAKQLTLFNKATISTIDSFCNKIVQQDCIRYGIPSDFTIDNNKASQITRRCVQQLVEQDDILPGFKFLSKAYHPNNLIDKVLVKLANSSFYFPLEFDKEPVFEKCNNLIDGTIRENAEKMFYLFKTISEDDFGSLTPAASKNVESIQQIYEELKTYDAENKSFVEKLSLITIPLPRVSKKNDRTIELNSLCKELQEVLLEITPFYHIKFNNHLEDVVNALEKLKNMIFEEKRKSGILTFSDISNLAVDILLKNKKIRKIYKEKYKFIMVDEFQDNNQLQKDLTYLLSENKNEFNDVVPNITSIEKNKLFFVGDEKQSIYMFRGADVSVFKALSDEIASNGGRVINLGVNYRSEPKLIDYFNKAFEKVFENPKENFEATFDSLNYRAPKDGIDPKIELYIKSEESQSLVTGDVEEASSSACEATKVAKIINKMLKTDEYLIPSSQGNRRPNVDDIAILMRSKNQQIEFEKALRAKKIPFIIQDNKAFPLEALSNDLYNILQLLIYPDDTLAYTSVLKGPFGAISEKSIIFLLQAQNCESLFECNITLDKDDQNKLQHLKTTFDDLIELSKDNDISSLLNYLWWDCGLRYYYVCEPNYHLYIDNYSYLYRMAKKYDDNQLSLTVFLDDIRDNLGSSSTQDEVDVLREQSAGVQLMTIHKSKGLEFPIVIVASMGVEMNRNTIDFSIENNIPVPKHCISLNMKKKKEKYDSVFIDKAAQLNQEMKLAEVKRVLYVALTRAETHLIMTGTIRRNIESDIKDKSDKTLLAMIYNASMDENGKVLPHLKVKDIEVVDIYENYVKVEKKPILERKLFLTNQNFYQVNQPNYDTSSKSIGVTTLVGYVDDGEGENGEALPLSKVDSLLEKLSERDERVFTDFGTLCHIYVQALVSQKPLLPLKDESILSKGSSLSKLTPPQIELIQSVAQGYAKAFIESDFYTEYVKDSESKCEVGFFSRVEKTSDQILVVEGFIDLLIKDRDNNFIVVDFKTDKFRNPEIHKMQIETYITAVKRMYPNSCVRGCIVYLREKDREYFY